MPPTRQRLKNLLKRVFPYRYSLSVYHRLRNRRTLTVVVFHRVIAADDPRWPGAHSEWTVSDEVFEECLVFFRRNYHLVGLDDLLASLRNGHRLPPRSLLITFDDGYADNEEYALPVMLRHGVRPVLFITSGFLNRRSRPWTEDLMSAYKNKRISPEEVVELYKKLFSTVSETPLDSAALLSDICAHWPGLADAEVEAVCNSVLEHPLERVTTPSQMLTSEQLRVLHAAGVAIGAHGRTHTSLSRSIALGSELHEPRQTLSELLGLPSPDSISALAFPYGDYSEQVVACALDEGYQLLFTFDPGITLLQHGRLVSHLIDRVNVSGATLAPGGSTSPESLARYFFFLPRSCHNPASKGLGTA